MSDIIDRLRSEIANGKDFHVLMIETAREISGLQAIIAAQEAKIEQLRAANRATVGLQKGVSPVDIDLRNNLRVVRDRVEQLQEEIEQLRAKPCPYVTGTVTKYCTLTPFTLTEEERRAVDQSLNLCPDPKRAAALRSILDRVCTRGEGTSQGGCALTDQERVAITAAYDDYSLYPDPGGRAQHIAMRLKGLLDRTQEATR